MNVLKHMRGLLGKTCTNQKNLQFLNVKTNYFSQKKLVFSKREAISSQTSNKLRSLHGDHESIDSDIDEPSELPELASYEEPPAFTRNVLYPNTTDFVMRNMNNCSSVQEILDIIKDNRDLNSRQMTQAVAVIWDLVKVLYHVNGIPDTRGHMAKNNLIPQLYENQEFQNLLSSIEMSIPQFDVYSLSYVYLCLNKLGLDWDNRLIKLLVERIKEQLLEDFSLSSASRFIVATFSDTTLRPYFVVKEIVPEVFKCIETCRSAEDVKFLTICLNNLQAFVTKELLHKYTQKIVELMDTGVINSHEYKTILKILIFLNHAEWRECNISLIRKCGVILKNSLDRLNTNEICLLSELFARNLEPAEIFTDIKRSAKKLWLQIEEESNPNLHTRLNLLAVLISASTTSQRPQYEATVAKYMEEDLQFESLITMRKILSGIKTSDIKLCHTLWYKMGKLNAPNLLKLVTEYTSFSVDLNNFRYKKLENQLLFALEREMQDGIYGLVPSILAHISMFILPYSGDSKQIENMVSRLCENWDQFSCMDWLKIAKGLQVARDITKNYTLKPYHYTRINATADMYVLHRLGKFDLKSCNLMLKGYIIRNDGRNDNTSCCINYLLLSYNEYDKFTSIEIKNSVFCLKETNSLLPDTMRRIGQYISENGKDMLGICTEKFLYLCYLFDYNPENCDKFFDTVSDILIRDTERLNGLTYLQAALALCYFNKLPYSIIKQIFNTAFLDKLDAELAVCYSKESYPQRVRHHMMQLNRAVCLDYPEANVPWFHEKYIDERNKRSVKMKSKEYIFQMEVNESLLQLIGDVGRFKKNVVSPYGYFIDFVVYLNRSEEVVEPGSGQISTQLALLLLRQSAYTQFCEQLKGQYKLKKRHLEILGYKVLFVKFSDWIALKSSRERIQYLKAMFWPNKSLENSFYIVKR